MCKCVLVQYVLALPVILWTKFSYLRDYSGLIGPKHRQLPNISQFKRETFKISQNLWIRKVRATLLRCLPVVFHKIHSATKRVFELWVLVKLFQTEWLKRETGAQRGEERSKKKNNLGKVRFFWEATWICLAVHPVKHSSLFLYLLGQD